MFTVVSTRGIVYKLYTFLLHMWPIYATNLMISVLKTVFLSLK